MEVFGSRWKNHWQRIAADWKSRVSDDDVVLTARRNHHSNFT